MDPFKILKRAWHILWQYRALWIFGIILALTVGGSFSGGGGNGGSSGGGTSNNGEAYEFDLENQFTNQQWQSLYDDVEEGFNELSQDMNFTGEAQSWWIGVAIGLICLVLVFAIIAAIARYVSETALMKMVNNYEETGEKVGIKGGLRYGWSRTSWRLFLINILVHLPVILFLFFMFGFGVLMFFLVQSANVALSIGGAVLGIGLFFVAIMITVVLMAVLKLLRHFMWRACALQDMGVIESIKTGYLIVRSNLKDAAIMWLVMIGFAITYAIFSFIAFFVLIPVFLITFILGLVVGAVPALLIAGLVSLLEGGALPWILAAVIGLPVMFLIGLSPVIFLRGLKEAYKSIVWTLTYRELNVLDELSAGEVEIVKS